MSPSDNVTVHFIDLTYNLSQGISYASQPLLTDRSDGISLRLFPYQTPGRPAVGSITVSRRFNLEQLDFFSKRRQVSREDIALAELGAVLFYEMLKYGSRDSVVKRFLRTSDDQLFMLKVDLYESIHP